MPRPDHQRLFVWSLCVLGLAAPLRAQPAAVQIRSVLLADGGGDPLVPGSLSFSGGFIDIHSHSTN